MNNKRKREGRNVCLSFSRSFPRTFRRPRSHDSDFLIDLNLAAFDHLAVQRKFPPEALDDVAQDTGLMSQRIWIEGGHDAPAPQVMDANHHIADQQLPLLPFPLLQAPDTSHDDIGPKTPPIAPKFGNRAIGCNQKREYVEAIQAIVTDQARTWADNLPDPGQNTRICPRLAVHQGITAWVHCGPETKQVWIGAGGDRLALLVVNLDDSIALDSRLGQAGGLELFSRHRLHGITPDFFHKHKGCPLQCKGGTIGSEVVRLRPTE
jgi:hypothetical protein